MKENKTQSADDILKEVLVKLNVIDADSKSPPVKTGKTRSSCHIIQGKDSLINMMTGIRRDINDEKAASGYYDISVEFFNDTKKLTKKENELCYKISGLLLLETPLFSVSTYPEFDDYMNYWYREKGAHIFTCTITASLYRDDKFRTKKYKKLLNLLELIHRMT